MTLEEGIVDIQLMKWLAVAYSNTEHKSHSCWLDYWTKCFKEVHTWSMMKAFGDKACISVNGTIIMSFNSKYPFTAYQVDDSWQRNKFPSSIMNNGIIFIWHCFTLSGVIEGLSKKCRLETGWRGQVCVKIYFLYRFGDIVSSSSGHGMYGAIEELECMGEAGWIPRAYEWGVKDVWVMGSIVEANSDALSSGVYEDDCAREWMGIVRTGELQSETTG